MTDSASFSATIALAAVLLAAPAGASPAESARSSTDVEQTESYKAVVRHLDQLVPDLTGEQVDNARNYAAGLKQAQVEYLREKSELQRTYLERIHQAQQQYLEGTGGEDAESPSSGDGPHDRGEAPATGPHPEPQAPGDPAAAPPPVPVPVPERAPAAPETLPPGPDGIPEAAPYAPGWDEPVLGKPVGPLDSDLRDELILDGARRFGKAVADSSRRYNLAPGFVLCIIRLESDYRGDAVSSAGALGFMQLMPGTARDLNVNPYDIRENIEGGCRMIDGLLREYSEDVTLAMAAYNAGPGRVQKYGGVPPFRETQDYVRRIAAQCGSPRP